MISNAIASSPSIPPLCTKENRLVRDKAHNATRILCYTNTTSLASRIPYVLAPLIFLVDLHITLVSDHLRAKEPLCLGVHHYRFSDYFKENFDFYGAIVTTELQIHSFLGLYCAFILILSLYFILLSYPIFINFY